MMVDMGVEIVRKRIFVTQEWTPWFVFEILLWDEASSVKVACHWQRTWRSRALVVLAPGRHEPTAKANLRRTFTRVHRYPHLPRLSPLVQCLGHYWGHRLYHYTGLQRAI